MDAPRTVPTDAPRLIVLAGLPGTGKSTMARALARATGAVWLRVDRIEASLLASGIPRSFETGLAAYVAARDLAEDHLRLGHQVIIDAVNGVPQARAMWSDLARACAVDRRVIELVCGDREVHRRRVSDRPPPTPPLPAPSWEEVVQREYQPWDEPVLRVDTRRPEQECLEKVLAYLHGPGATAAPG